MPQFDIAAYFPQIFWLAIWFGILFWGISKFLVPKYVAISRGRQKKAVDQLSRIDVLQKKIEDLQYENEILLDEAQKKSAIIMETTIQKIHKDHEKKKKSFEKKLQNRTAAFDEKLDLLQKDLTKECEAQSRAITESMLVKLTGSKPPKVKFEKILKTTGIKNNDVS